MSVPSVVIFFIKEIEMFVYQVKIMVQFHLCHLLHRFKSIFDSMN